MSSKLVEVLADREKNGATPFISYEFFPPKTEKGVENLMNRIESLKETKPMFVDFTWGAGGSTADLTLDLSIDAKKRGFEPNMHLTCTNMDVQLIDRALVLCKAHGIRNIVALRGDPPAGKENWKETKGGFSCALDLVRYIRQVYGKYFGVSVAGYPEGHPSRITRVNEDDGPLLTEEEVGRTVVLDDGIYVCRDIDFKHELQYLKAKVEAGADFIITQMFFDVQCFFSFVKACRNIGIQCPIVPGIMCIQAYGGFDRMTKFCKSRVPQVLRQRLEKVKDNDALVKQVGIAIGVEMCQDLLDSKLVPGLHFYTLNQDKTVRAICKGLSL